MVKLVSSSQTEIDFPFSDLENNSNGQKSPIKRQVLSSEVTPEPTKQLAGDHHDYPGILVKSYSVCGRDNFDSMGAVESSPKRDNNLLFKSQIEAVSGGSLAPPGPKLPGSRANGNMLSQSMHHSPARPADHMPNASGDKTGAGGQKNGSVKEEISKFSYKRLVGHLERKYQDIRNIFRTETGPRAQARLASPSPSPSKPK